MNRMTKSLLPKRKLLLETALSLFVSRGFIGTPTAMITREAGVATGTLFHYFRSKEELIEELFWITKKEMGEALRSRIVDETTVKGKVLRVCQNYLVWGINNHDKVKFLRLAHSSPLISKATQKEVIAEYHFLYEIIREGIDKGIIRDVAPDLLILMFGTSLDGAIDFILEKTDENDRSQYMSTAFDLLWIGISGNIN